MSHREIKEFINDYTIGEGTEEQLLNGYCYEFACKLRDNFPGGEILHDSNHVVYKYEEKHYDGSGELPDSVVADFKPISDAPNMYADRNKFLL